MRKINFNEPYLAGQELEYIKQVFDNKQFGGNGPFTKKVERLLQERYSVEKVLLTDSCTSALEMSALLLEIGVGDEVILPSYTFSTTASAFLRTGCTLVFAEINPKNMMIDPIDVERKITRNTKVIAPIHYGGIAADVVRLRKICDENGVTLVEDAAQALDSYLDEKPLGTFGALGCFSFHETKNIHAGLSGALFVNDSDFADRATYIRERGTNREQVLKGLADKYSWVELGSSFYPTEFQAAFLFAQLKSLDENTLKRRDIYDEYNVQLLPLAENNYFSLPELPIGNKINYHAYFIIFNDELQCDYVRESLANDGVSAYIGYVPLHSSPMGKKLGYMPDDLPLTEEYAKRVLRLPFHNNMDIDDVQYVSEKIKRYTREFSD
ncbi:MAG: dTDP-4-amino-4,6-dideoxygalactose transaminase [Gammaproteobacteria bacterium]|nr:dTDP-4-amino-4,6-dideoxygalactose transaminase [Gammaproteobacteria bacterium]MCF6337249.1 dTDP-4-amino-4,6-dideoxygalactose transaminase [Gammaproteobacteria bacterium]